MTAREMINNLRNERINTWFDLGLFIDRFKENKKIPSCEFMGFYEDFKESVQSNGIGFITFDFGIDGVTIEICKYAKAFRKFLKNVPIHLIGSKFYPEGKHLLDKSYKKFEIENTEVFNRWPLYEDFFLTKLERGSSEYNELIHRYWKEVLYLAEKLGCYIEKNKINLLYLINICSNPGNVSLSLAAILVSEYLGIPVINNNHDFYWEGGNRQIDIVTHNIRPGPRDFFFTNSDIGEFFSLMEVILPWESRSWISVNINKNQTRHLININGYNPANVTEINTAVNIKAYKNVPKEAKVKAFIQIKDILARYKKKIRIQTPEQIYNNSNLSRENIEPVIIGNGDPADVFNFTKNNIIFLQPTRVMVRKRIEIGFDLIKKLFNNKEFTTKIDQNPLLHITLLVTGPIAQGQYEYFTKLVKNFDKFLKSLENKYKKRIFLGFLFSEFDKKRFTDKYKLPLTILELFNIASLILLPSETEGRGLPIIEAAACGVPIFVNRFYPRRVFEEVIGKNLIRKLRFQVFEFSGNEISKKMAAKILEWIFFPQKYISDIEHNRAVVEERYSMKSLENNIRSIFFKLYSQLKPNQYSIRRAGYLLKQYKKIAHFKNQDLESLVNIKKRYYMPGYGILMFMNLLKSLIDPSYFRIEEQLVRGMAMKFAMKLVSETSDKSNVDIQKLNRFYNTIDNIFLYRKGEISIRHDHSLAYRHRNKNYYPYQDFTFQELTGLINMFFLKIFEPKIQQVISDVPNLFNDLNMALYQLTNSQYLEIDNRKELIDKLGKKIPIAIFPGEYIKYELELFALLHIRKQLKQRGDKKLEEDLIQKEKDTIVPVYVFCSGNPLGKNITAKSLENYIKTCEEDELKMLYKHSLIKIVETKQLCVGIHIPQLGKTALHTLNKIKDQNGILITCKPHACVTTDIVNIDKFHIGCAKDKLIAKIMGISEGSGYVQYVPAGVRTTLAFPTPVQTAKDFYEICKSKEYMELEDKIGKTKLAKIIKHDAEDSSTPISELINNLLNEKKKQGSKKTLSYSYISGIYKDRLPWSGALASVDKSKSIKKWKFITVSNSSRMKVTDFVDKYEKKLKVKIDIAWNGGYMLNAELVGKLGLPESYIGSPLGLIISNGKIICPPLFNKPAFIIKTDGTLNIKRVNSKNGLIVSDSHNTFKITDYNKENPKENSICFYDLLYKEKSIPGNGRIIVRLAGTVIKEVIKTKKNESIKVLPVGIVLSFPAKQFPDIWNNQEKNLNVELVGWEHLESAIEAGPLLLDNSQKCIDMEKEGWKTENSIRTQAARLDFTDMRGPKIAIGIDKRGNLSVLTINGRIRESVGASHIDMAEIIAQQGMSKAMGFDPGGSSTLFAAGKILNISPYNSEYEKDVISLPPEPRPVGNAVLGYQE